MPRETIFFSDMFDRALADPLDLAAVLNKLIPVHPFTDSECLFEAIIKVSRTSEKRMMPDIAAAQEKFRDVFILDIGFVRSSKNNAESLVKPIIQAVFRNTIENRCLNLQPDQ